MAHPGIGVTGHLATSLFAQQAKVTVDHIPYRGAAPALQDIAGGHVDLFFATPQSVLQQVAAGQMKAYGITAKEPSPQFPGVASFVQALGPKLEILYWHALFAPAGTPDAIVETLNATRADHCGRSGAVEELGGYRCFALSAGSAFARGRPRAVQERDRPLGTGRARQQHPGADPVAPPYFFVLRMIFSENRYPSPIGVEDMLFGIMRAPAPAPAPASPTCSWNRCSDCRSGSGGSRLPGG